MVTDKGKFAYLVKDAKGALFLVMVNKVENMSHIEGVRGAQWVREFHGEFNQLPALCLENGFQCVPEITMITVKTPAWTEYPDFPDLPQ